jgi:hypothetical protein
MPHGRLLARTRAGRWIIPEERQGEAMNAVKLFVRQGVKETTGAKPRRAGAHPAGAAPRAHDLHDYRAPARRHRPLRSVPEGRR